ncbi:MAG: methyltransferase domain-containing protein [Nostoc sp.]
MNFMHDPEVYNTKAAKEIIPLILSLLNPKSVVDVGCGLGSWLSVFEKYSVKDIVGIDSAYINRNLLYISEEKFILWDLNQPLNLNRKFDLVISLEVAEHLPEEVAESFIKSLVSLGDFILFSAAIPNQGGQDHLNEQWPNYWQNHFRNSGFELYDCIRPHIWQNQNIDYWYQQNIFLAVKNGTAFFAKSEQSNLLNLVHPKLYEWRIQQLDFLDPNLKDCLLHNIPLITGLKIIFKIFIISIGRLILPKSVSYWLWINLMNRK